MPGNINVEKGGEGEQFIKNGFYTIKVNSRALFLFSFFITISLFTSWLDQVERKIYGVKPGVTMAGEKLEGLLPAELRLWLEDMALRQQELPVEPGLDKETGEVIHEQEGCIVDIEGSVSKALQAGEGEKLDLLMRAIPARYSCRDLERISSSRGYYETWFRGTYQRYNNISLACSGVNNSVLWPGQDFSFNETVGPRTPERGYMPAPVFLMGASELDYGGGVCQVSTTVFNAAEKAGLKIIERHLHTRAVHYVPEGKDAAVSYGDLDLKFSNSTDNPLIIKAGIIRGKVWVNIMGEGD
ncbi:MAG: VanW family protein [Syntrophomonas sp.]|uniref:VanW family protein n=1 Tax=Syntrophomonas sp. TaxID=2053627 RepID=UPI00263192ED|nr:VanW family protein [Syntrophomonas sp.]MDD2511104.1 VanW family protein [Syntrophomonas sp.]MDD3879584.1 VanW family protein [Syntrophomonas sp.]MDD4627252.1 VanW family protein [Syntrophomonas sp.]